jgi:hypothetical protein
MVLDKDEKHIIEVTASTVFGKKTWVLKIYYPNQGGIVKTIYAPEQDGIVDLTEEQEVEPTPEPLVAPEPTPQVIESVLPQ